MADTLVDTAIKEVTPEAFLEFYQGIRRAKEKMEHASGLYKAARKMAKKGGVDLAALKLMEELAKLEPEDADTRMRNLRLYLAWDGQGTQLEMFAATVEREVKAPKDKAAQQHACFQAEETGYDHGKLGGDQRDCAYAPGTDLQAAWIRGWSRGQESIAMEMAPDAKPKKASTRRKMAVPEDSSPAVMN